MIGAVIGAVIWNHRNAGIAMNGVEFDVPVDASAAVSTIASTHGTGARATAKRVLWGITVSPARGNSFTYVSRIGDEGAIEVTGQGTSARVRAHATSLYVGSHPMTHSNRGGLWAFCTYVSHVIYKVLGITPNAAKLKRFHNGFRRRLLRELSRSTAHRP